MKISLEEINNVLKVIEPIYFKFKQESHAKKNYEEMEILKLKTKILKLQTKNLKLKTKILKLKNKNLKLVNEKKVLKRRANFFGKEIRKKNGIVLEINEKYREHKNWKCSNNYSNLNKQINHPCDKYPDSINDESLLSEDDEYEQPQEEPRPDENVITEDDTDDAESLASLLEKEEKEEERLRVREHSHDEDDDEDDNEDAEDNEDDGEDENVHEDEKHEKDEKDDEDDDEDDDDEDDEEELYEITINNVDYYTTDQLETNGPVYEILDDGDYGKIVGHLKNKKFTPI